jgi:hypothetical protein
MKVSVARIAFGLLMLIGYEAMAGEPLTQADREWLRSQCGWKNTKQECVSALAKFNGEGREVTEHDILGTTPTSEELLSDAVEKCIQTVKKDIPASGFDAYVDKEIVRGFGTPLERFKFDKCMHNSGYSAGNIANP